jgi:YidC/Oxa1 family membrane protein insertase
MSLLQGWKAWRTFRRLPWQWRNLVFYAESGQDWHQFAGLIEVLNDELGRKVCYVTSDPADAGLARRHANYTALHIPAGLFLTIFFQVKQADVVVLTMMDLNNLQLKRSLHPVHYIYLFHSMGSTHMVDHANSFDHYETLFCSGPHQLAEIRRREALKHLPAKHLFDYGHPRLEQVMREAEDYRASRTGQPGPHPHQAAVILVAPTWGVSSIFNVCGEELLTVLLQAGFHVIMRPHYHSTRLTPQLISALRHRFSSHSGFAYVDRMADTDSLLRSGLLISDWSAMALEYALGLEKPVLFIDVPRRIRNPDWQELGMEPVESSMRRQLGCVVSPDRLEEVPAAIHHLLDDAGDFPARMRALRAQFVFRLGHSIADGAAEIARLADQQMRQRLARENDHA